MPLAPSMPLRSASILGRLTHIQSQSPQLLHRPCQAAASLQQRQQPRNFSTSYPRPQHPRLPPLHRAVHPARLITVTAHRTVATSTTSPPTPAANAQRAPPPHTDQLTWNRFLALRRTRRRISLAASVVTAVLCTGGGLSALTAGDLDAVAAQVSGLDPVAVLGLSTAALAAVGWLAGPAFGNAAFRVAYGRYRRGIEAKERDFYARIKKRRADPSTSTLANPAPDFYGEKIGSVADYRRWLKDQRAFNLKRGEASV